MAAISLNGTVLSVSAGLQKPQVFDFEKLRLVYLVTTGNMKGFIVQSSWDIYAIDVDDPDMAEAVTTMATLFGERKTWGLSEIKLCLANYEQGRLEINLKKIKNAGVDLFTLLSATRDKRVAYRNDWLQTGQSVLLRGRNRVNIGAQGAVFSEKKKISWDEVDRIQLDKQESLVTVTSLLLIPAGVSGGAFSMKKYKYALRGIPNKQAELYLAECLFWKNGKIDKDRKTLEDKAKEELIRDGIISE
ncbi:MAG: hypothetical protein JW874_07995 [Spirochaetales bacterium]|nr:hypothetical protein [Spirochaetales bacterium]